MTNFENKAKENMRRKLRLVNCGIKSEQTDNFITNFIAFYPNLRCGDQVLRTILELLLQAKYGQWRPGT